VYYVSVVTGTSDGRFVTRSYLVGPTPVQLEKADFNHDGNLDLAVLSIGTAGSYAQQLYIMLGAGDGGFQPAYAFGMATTDAVAHFAVGDFNGDTWADLALLEPGSSRIRIGINKATALPGEFGFSESAASVPVGFGATLIDAGRFDADARDDLVVVRTLGAAQGDVSVLLAQGEGFAAGGSASFPLNPTCLVVYSIDRDGTPDCAIGGAAATGGGACVIPGDGAGNLGAAVVISIPESPAYIDAGDMDGNGTGDLVLVETAARMLVSVLVRDGDAPLAVFLRGDANGDGKLDISDAVKILRFLFSGDTSDCAEALDANDDGRLDIADAVFLLGYLFSEGPRPPAPFPDAGSVPPVQSLGCERL